ncbi:hypothetical protein N7516_003605 [Penicillium verrucosum]|uniref:uncharacterized protein n=1 Tax=Penicillium verrucosum TaxID=60171 RepID=UPI0025455EB9|nr:uncharacterized protein N7516_003605 [Penicillium verrucosum]KAJ5943437.1 hypothetical protein N7516_003605 [Penicillium verrucosum]
MAVNKAIDLAIQRMGLDLAIHHYPGVDINVDGKKKQPDMGWVPIRPPRGLEGASNKEEDEKKKKE